MTEPRIISLIASATEIVCALGHESQLVGRSHECDFPPSVELLPVCSASRIDVSASSSDIDRQVKATVAEALSVYRVLDEELDRLRPTVILTQTQCDVCAVSLKDVEQAVCRMVRSRPEIVALEPMQLSDLWNDIRKVAAALDDTSAGDRLVSLMQERLRTLRESVPRSGARPKVLCLEWLDPLMIGGNWIPELVEIAGGEAVLAQPGKHSPWTDWDEIAQADPDIIVMLPCGFDIPRTLQEAAVLPKHAAWNKLRAVQMQRVYVTDGNQYFNRPGPRLVESAEILSEIIHPGLTSARHEHAGWISHESRPAG